MRVKTEATISQQQIWKTALCAVAGDFTSKNLFINHGDLQHGNCCKFFFQKGQTGFEQVELSRGNGALIVMDGNMRGGCMHD
jgi:hypothetical protein